MLQRPDGKGSPTRRASRRTIFTLGVGTRQRQPSRIRPPRDCARAFRPVAHSRRDHHANSQRRRWAFVKTVGSHSDHARAPYEPPEEDG
jgi:hypothetical protein